MSDRAPTDVEAYAVVGEAGYVPDDIVTSLSPRARAVLSGLHAGTFVLRRGLPVRRVRIRVAATARELLPVRGRPTVRTAVSSIKTSNPTAHRLRDLGLITRYNAVTFV